MVDQLKGFSRVGNAYLRQFYWWALPTLRLAESQWRMLAGGNYPEIPNSSNRRRTRRLCRVGNAHLRQFYWWALPTLRLAQVRGKMAGYLKEWGYG